MAKHGLKGGDQNILYFGSPKRENRREGEKKRGEEEEEEEEEEKKKRNQDKKGMDSMIFGMDITWKVRILWFCMEF